MRGFLTRGMTIYFVLIGLYLILIHNTGFAKDISSLGGFVTGTAKTFQGR